MVTVSRTGELLILSSRKEPENGKEESSGRGKRVRRQYTQEFREESVQMLLNGHSATSVAERLGLLRFRRQKALGARFNLASPEAVFQGPKLRPIFALAWRTLISGGN